MSTTSTYGFGVTLDLPFEEAIERTTAALKAEGFGVRTTIDVRKTLDEKIGVAFEPYVILGACNPQLAHRALDVEREIGLLLPCNVVVRADGDGTLVQALDPEVMVGITEQDGLRGVADEASRRIQAALEALQRE
jgi:uncharacterized protein (DUF302 family)